MKPIIGLFPTGLCLMSMLLSACEESNSWSLNQPHLNVELLSRQVDPRGDLVKITVQSTQDWTLTGGADWATVDKKKGGPSPFFPDTVYVTVLPNHTELREAKFSLTSGGLQEEVSLSQAGNYQALAQIEGLESSALGYGYIKDTLFITSSSAWSLSSDMPWITFTPSSGEACLNEPQVILMDMEINFGAARDAEVTLRSQDVNSQKIAIHQPKYQRQQTAQRVGDPGVQFDDTRVDPRYKEKMDIWRSAGVIGGIPVLEDQLKQVTKTFEAGTPCHEIATYFQEHSTQPVIVLLKNGDYTFDESVRLYSNHVLIGESRDGVKITVDPRIGSDHPITLWGATHAGVRNFHIHGGWLNEDGNNYPKYPFRVGQVTQELKAEGMAGHIMINMKMPSDDAVSNSYLDNVRITNSASHPVWLRGEHITVRGAIIDGSFNKDGGCQGYMFLGGGKCLITGCQVTNLRHISMQGEGSEFNVFYDNDLEQEVSFHVGDGGDNLIEYNRIYLREDMFEGYNAIMGPWSTSHYVGGLNYIYNNRCKEDCGDRGGKTPWSDDQLYLGPYEMSVGGDNPNRYINFKPVQFGDTPSGRTLYPIVLE